MTEKNELIPGKTALLVVDCQNDFCHPDGVSGRAGVALADTHAALPVLKSLIDKVRGAGASVIFARTHHHEDWTDSPTWSSRFLRQFGPVCAPGTWGAEFYEVSPTKQDFVVTKHRYSAFIGTDLDITLRSKGIDTLLCTGFITNVCVESTLRDGYMLNYATILVEDCCAAPTPEEHRMTVFNIKKYFGRVLTSSQIVGSFGSAT